ncbi:hypothetical protein E2320_002190 [Naja naja]|nr:hypothetical protein E2320_002190 [Naja naja]
MASPSSQEGEGQAAEAPHTFSLHWLLFVILFVMPFHGGKELWLSCAVSGYSHEHAVVAVRGGVTVPTAAVIPAQEGFRLCVCAGVCMRKR